MSRLGVMFFDDPHAAFANLWRAARPRALLAFIAWRSREENPFMTVAEAAASYGIPADDLERDLRAAATVPPPS